MNIIFLDFDGVLNGRRFLSSHTDVIDMERMPYLQQIIEATGAQVVLSTSWRVHWEPSPDKCDSIGHEINRIFAQYGITIMGKTPSTDRFHRVVEIKQWLNDHPETERFVILDDTPFGWGELAEYHVLTNALQYGLDEAATLRAISILLRDEKQ